MVTTKMFVPFAPHDLMQYFTAAIDHNNPSHESGHANDDGTTTALFLPRPYPVQEQLICNSSRVRSTDADTLPTTFFVKLVSLSLCG